MTLLAVAAAFGLQGCDWGVNGLDRMEEKFPSDADMDAVDVGDDTTETDAIDDVGGQDTAVTDVADDTPGGDATDANLWPDVSYEGIEGRWVGRLVSNGKINVVIEELPMTTTDLFLVEGTGSGLTMTFCDELIKVVPGEFISNTTETKPALREAISATPVEVAVSGTEITAQQIVWRWALAESIGNDDPLPAANKEDSSVNLLNYPDIDDDGQPGVTIAVSVDMSGSVTVGERYMAKRAKFDLADGTMSMDGRWITGSMTFTVDEIVLGAEPKLLNQGAQVVPTVEGTFYQFRRVDDQMDCAALVAGHEGLFADAP